MVRGELGFTPHLGYGNSRVAIYESISRTEYLLYGYKIHDKKVRILLHYLSISKCALARFLYIIGFVNDGLYQIFLFLFREFVINSILINSFRKSHFVNFTFDWFSSG